MCGSAECRRGRECFRTVIDKRERYDADDRDLLGDPLRHVDGPVWDSVDDRLQQTSTDGLSMGRVLERHSKEGAFPLWREEKGMMPARSPPYPHTVGGLGLESSGSKYSVRQGWRKYPGSFALSLARRSDQRASSVERPPTSRPVLLPNGRIGGNSRIGKNALG